MKNRSHFSQNSRGENAMKLHYEGMFAPKHYFMGSHRMGVISIDCLSFFLPFQWGKWFEYHIISVEWFCRMCVRLMNAHFTKKGSFVCNGKNYPRLKLLNYDQGQRTGRKKHFDLYTVHLWNIFHCSAISNYWFFSHQL